MTSLDLFAVAAGSAIGGVLRVLLAGAVQLRAATAIPSGTLVVNVLGSLVVGGVARYALHSQTFPVAARLFLAAGLCGGFTTFSSFSVETFQLVQRGDTTLAIGYTLVSAVTCVAATAAGYALVGFTVARS